MSDQPVIHDSESASLAAWNLASQYLADMDRARNTCFKVLDKIGARNESLSKLLAQGEFDAKGNGDQEDFRPFTPTEICQIHKCLTETEKTTIMIATTIIRDANVDTFTEFIRRTKAAGVIMLSEEDREKAAGMASEVRKKEIAGGPKLLPGRVSRRPKNDPVEVAVRRLEKREPS